jgi:hypothetical protein
MAALLEKLGVPKDVRLFFRPYFSVQPDGSLSFPFGAGAEHFGRGFHRVPHAIHPWAAGSGPLIFVAFSAMECIAFLSLYRHRYAELNQLQFVATGYSQEVPALPKHSKICLLLGSDTLGHLSDIHLATAIRGKQLHIMYLAKERYRLAHHGRIIVLHEQALSLSAAEKGLGIRTGIRTQKPKGFHTFLEQLKTNSSWY